MSRAIFILALIPVGILAYPGGAPNCEVEQPKHGGDRQTTNLFDFYVIEMAMTTPGSIVVSIEPKEGEYIKGLRLYSPTPNNNWVLTDDSKIDFQIMDCGGVTHVNGKEEKRGKYTFEMEFPEDEGVPKFDWIVVKDFSTWWVNPAN
eukprot:maker-scaffold1041_size68021-snap-gene-0.13 protein:Tk05342 transcript:maker-scaffold1041_size68021-snap-gene-0.13-mRNA-1 annotation:"defense protein"